MVFWKMLQVGIHGQQCRANRAGEKSRGDTEIGRNHPVDVTLGLLAELYAEGSRPRDVQGNVDGASKGGVTLVSGGGRILGTGHEFPKSRDIVVSQARQRL